MDSVFKLKTQIIIKHKLIYIILNDIFELIIAFWLVTMFEAINTYGKINWKFKELRFMWLLQDYINVGRESNQSI